MFILDTLLNPSGSIWFSIITLSSNFHVYIYLWILKIFATVFKVLDYSGASLGARMVMNVPSMQETHDPWFGKVSWRRKWLPTPVFLPGKFHGERSLAGYSLWGCKELGTTEGLTLSPLILSSLFFLDLEMMTYFSWLWITFSLQLADISLDAGHWEHFSIESIVFCFSLSSKCWDLYCQSVYLLAHLLNPFESWCWVLLDGV